MWKERCADRTTPVVGERIVAEDDSLSKKITHLYTLREMVLPEDELKIFNKPIYVRLEDSNQQIKKWLTRWRPVIDHSMTRVKELAQDNSRPIWKHVTSNKLAKTKISRKVSTRTQIKKKSDNPLLTNVYTRLQKKRSSSRVSPVLQAKYKMNSLMSTLYAKLGKKRPTRRQKLYWK